MYLTVIRHLLDSILLEIESPKARSLTKHLGVRLKLGSLSMLSYINKAHPIKPGNAKITGIISEKMEVW